ncbi:MAG: hypothetical protein ABJE95_37165 [Byssovorax sp.]
MNDSPPDSTPPDEAVAPATEAEAAPPAEKINFDRAEFEEPAGEHVECGLCQRAIHTEYWEASGKILCAACREKMDQTAARAAGGATFAKAFLKGGAVAFACGIGYAIFVGLTEHHFALVTIGIGWAVGTVVHKVTQGFGSRKHQILAAALTYAAATMGYLPGIIKEFREMGEHPQDTMSASSGGTASSPPAPASTGVAIEPDGSATVQPPSDPPAAPSARPSVGRAIVLLLVLVVGVTLAAPFLSVGADISSLLGLLIIFFGMSRAWRASKGVQATITGPHRVGGEGPG